MQHAIPYMQLRGGSSKGLYFCASDLPTDPVLRDKVLIAAIGADKSQIDGLGGADPLTSKVAIVGLSDAPDADIDYLFAQVVDEYMKMALLASVREQLQSTPGVLRITVVHSL